MDGTSVASDIVTAGTALAGLILIYSLILIYNSLILIYIGTLVTGFGAFQAQEQKAVMSQWGMVKPSYRKGALADWMKSEIAPQEYCRSCRERKPNDC
jgi:hypothetical protein